MLKGSVVELFTEMDSAKPEFTGVWLALDFENGSWVSISAEDKGRELMLELAIRMGGQPIGYIGALVEPPDNNRVHFWPVPWLRVNKESSDRALKRLDAIVAAQERQSNLVRLAQFSGADTAH